MRKTFRIFQLLYQIFGFQIKYIGLFISRLFISLFTNFTLFLDQLIFPGYKKVKFNKSVFLIGHLRSGTTFLHQYMLQNCKDVRGFYLWEMLFPALSARKIIKPLTPLLKKISLDKVWDPTIHKTGLFAAETDDIALNFKYFDGMLSWIYFSIWQEFSSDQEFEQELLKICQQDKFVTYLKDIYKKNIYKKDVGILAKSFFGLFNLETIQKEFPDSRIIILIRDPLEAIPSLMSLEKSVQNHINKFESRSEELKERYFNNLYKTSLFYYRYMHEAVSKNTTDSLLLVTHKQLMVDFENTFNRIVEFASLEKTTELQNAIKAQVARQKTFKTKHKYQLEDFDLNKEKIRKDFSFIYENYDI